MYTIANLPSIQRDLYLSRCLRRVEDEPISADTLCVKWENMVVSFSTDETIAEAAVEVAEEISLSVFSRRMESLLDCGAKSEGQKWIMKFSCHISDYGDPGFVRRMLCDKIASIDGETGETVGVLKIKRRSVEAGYAKIRIVPAEDSLQVIVRHNTAQGLKSVWKSLLWRLKPQYEEHQKEEVTEAVSTVEVTKPKSSRPEFYAGLEIWKTRSELCQKAVKLPGAEKFLDSGIYPLSEFRLKNSSGANDHGRILGVGSKHDLNTEGIKIVFRMATSTLEGLNLKPFKVERIAGKFVLSANFTNDQYSSYSRSEAQEAAVVAEKLGFVEFADPE